MKKKLLFYFILLIAPNILFAQTALEKASKRLSIDVNIPEDITASANERSISPCSITDDDPIPTIGQSYNVEFVQGNTAINAYFGLVTSILQFNDDDCVILVSIPPGNGASRLVSETDSTLEHVSQYIDFGTIKGGFRYGKPFQSVSLQEAEELNSMLTHYPDSLAQELFNAYVMVSYPINLAGNVYLDKYTRCWSVVAGKDGRQITLNFMMTDASISNFPNYLKRMKNVFWFSKYDPNLIRTLPDY